MILPYHLPLEVWNCNILLGILENCHRHHSPVTWVKLYWSIALKSLTECKQTSPVTSQNHAIIKCLCWHTVHTILNFVHTPKKLFSYCLVIIPFDLSYVTCLARPWDNIPLVFRVFPICPFVVAGRFTTNMSWPSSDIGRSTTFVDGVTSCTLPANSCFSLERASVGEATPDKWVDTCDPRADWRQTGFVVISHGSSFMICTQLYTTAHNYPW